LKMQNPFIIRPGEFWADRKHLWETILSYIDIVKHTRSNEIIVFTGDFGCGTTHTLRYLKKYLDSKNAHAVCIATPIEGDIEDIYTEFMNTLSPSFKEAIFSKIANQLIPESIRERHVPEDIRERRLVSGRREYTREDLENSLLKFLAKSGRLTLRDRNVLDEYVGVLPDTIELWSSILLELGTSEWPVFIILDEFDAALLAAVESEHLLYDLRRLYDETLRGLCIVIGLKGEPEDAKKKLGEALFSRMSLQPIHLYPLSKDEAKDFIKDIIKHQTHLAKSNSPYFPFTEDAIEVLLDGQCPILPRRLLRICSLIFENAEIENLRKIDTEFVLKVTAQFGQISFKKLTEGLPPKPKPLLVTTPIHELKDIVEYGADGSINLTVNPEMLTAKEVIGLILYASPSPIGMRDLTKAVRKNWKNVRIEYVSATLSSQMKGLIIREGKRGEYTYRLSGSGKYWIANELLPKLKERK